MDFEIFRKLTIIYLIIWREFVCRNKCTWQNIFILIYIELVVILSLRHDINVLIIKIILRDVFRYWKLRVSGVRVVVLIDVVAFINIIIRIYKILSKLIELKRHLNANRIDNWKKNWVSILINLVLLDSSWWSFNIDLIVDLLLIL